MSFRHWVTFTILIAGSAPFAGASIKGKPGRYTAVAFLSMQDPKHAKLYVNPMSRSRYTINVQNPGTVAKLLDKKYYFGQVKTTFKIYNPGAGYSAGEVESVQIVNDKRVPAYDGAFKPVK
jgi:hypothetical protein